jgi:hypothetical protein
VSANHVQNILDDIAKLIRDVKDLKGQWSAATPRTGTATLVAGAATVTLASVTANTRIWITIQTPGGTVGVPHVFSRIAGTSFTIHSSAGADTSTVAWQAIEPR